MRMIDYSDFIQTRLDPSSYKDMTKMYEELKEFSKQFNITILTAKAPICTENQAHII